MKVPIQQRSKTFVRPYVIKVQEIKRHFVSCLLLGTLFLASAWMPVSAQSAKIGFVDGELILSKSAKWQTMLDAVKKRICFS